MNSFCRIPSNLKYVKYILMKKIYAILLFAICTGFTYAQDIHFSQYYASPLTLNPALTGLVNGVFRASLNYRNQWFNIPTQNTIAPYQTYQASFDMPLSIISYAVFCLK